VCAAEFPVHLGAAQSITWPLVSL